MRGLLGLGSFPPRNLAIFIRSSSKIHPCRIFLGHMPVPDKEKGSISDKMSVKPKETVTMYGHLHVPFAATLTCGTATVQNHLPVNPPLSPPHTFHSAPHRQSMHANAEKSIRWDSSACNRRRRGAARGSSALRGRTRRRSLLRPRTFPQCQRCHPRICRSAPVIVCNTCY